MTNDLVDRRTLASLVNCRQELDLVLLQTHYSSRVGIARERVIGSRRAVEIA